LLIAKRQIPIWLCNRLVRENAKPLQVLNHKLGVAQPFIVCFLLGGHLILVKLPLGSIDAGVDVWIEDTYEVKKRKWLPARTVY
jgi:hypothetical protein